MGGPSAAPIASSGAWLDSGTPGSTRQPGEVRESYTMLTLNADGHAPELDPCDQAAAAVGPTGISAR